MLRVRGGGGLPGRAHEYVRESVEEYDGLAYGGV
jgi:hypothetical protein